MIEIFLTAPQSHTWAFFFGLNVDAKHCFIGILSVMLKENKKLFFWGEKNHKKACLVNITGIDKKQLPLQ